MISRLLYLLLRLILLLDRTICRIYDLPVWSRFAGVLLQAGRRRSVCALSVFGLLFLLPALLLTRPGTLLLADGQPLGVIEDSATLLNAVNAVESSASAVSGTDYYLPLRLQARPVRTAAPLLTQEELEHNLITASGELDTLAVISVDGRQTAIAADTDGAQAALDRIKAAYTTAADENVHFLQTVRVDKAVAPAALAETDSALYDTLSHCLDVTATRAVTYTEQIPFDTVTQENENQTRPIARPSSRAVRVQRRSPPKSKPWTVRSAHAPSLRTVLRQATDEIVEVGTRNVGIGTGEFAVPLNSYTFTSAFKYRWGRLHGGVDLAVDEGTPVYAADNGKVIVAEDSGNGYGSYIILDHQNGFKTLYGHNSQLLVSVGDVVGKGDKIALSGNTGNSTGPHLHFEVQVNDEKVDPTQYVNLS
ncbi:MAG: M23 family metallopeptidase [Butyricicoccus sp.]